MEADKKNILIVEDDMLLSFVEERIIRRLGYNVVGKAASGEEAIKKAHQLQPDLILMDILLKGEMDGVDAMVKIREASDVPVIYLSGNSDSYNYNRAKQTGFAGYLVKPITAKDLEKPLKKVFEEQSKSGADYLTKTG